MQTNKQELMGEEIIADIMSDFSSLISSIRADAAVGGDYKLATISAIEVVKAKVEKNENNYKAKSVLFFYDGEGYLKLLLSDPAKRDRALSECEAAIENGSVVNIDEMFVRLDAAKIADDCLKVLAGDEKFQAALAAETAKEETILQQAKHYAKSAGDMFTETVYTAKESVKSATACCVDSILENQTTTESYQFDLDWKDYLFLGCAAAIVGYGAYRVYDHFTGGEAGETVEVLESEW